MSDKGLVEAYYSIYKEKEAELTEEIVDEIFDELVQDLLSEGYEEEEAISILEEATDTYLEEAKVTFGHDTTPRRESGAPVGARRKYGKRKAGEALKAAGSAAKGAVSKAKAKAAGAAVDAALTASAAKKAAGSAASAVKSAPGKAKAAVEKKKQEAKKGIRGLIGRAAKKVASKASDVAKRMSEEKKMEGEDPCWKDYKMVGTKKKGGKEVPNCVPKEELEASGLFSEKEIEAIMEAEMNEGSYEDRIAANNKKYDRNRKRAAQRAAARNDARAQGKTGAVPGVGYVTPRKERETYTDSSGKTRHAKGL